MKKSAMSYTTYLWHFEDVMNTWNMKPGPGLESMPWYSLPDPFKHPIRFRSGTPQVGASLEKILRGHSNTAIEACKYVIKRRTYLIVLLIGKDKMMSKVPSMKRPLLVAHHCRKSRIVSLVNEELVLSLEYDD